MKGVGFDSDKLGFRVLEKLKELIDELELHGYSKTEIRMLGLCLQSYAIHGDMNCVQRFLGVPNEERPVVVNKEVN